MLDIVAATAKMKQGRAWDRLIGRGMSYSFAGPLPAVWSAMADTARYNAAAALPRQTITDGGPGWRVRFLAHAKMGPFTLEWEDLPCNWVRERWFQHRRRSAAARWRSWMPGSS